MYLRPWLLLEPLGLDQSHTVALAVVLIVAMFVAFCCLVRRVTAGTGVVLALAACSPAVMLAVERANMDITLFTVTAGAVLLWRRVPRVARVVSPILVLLAATAKMYPVFALPVFVVTRNRVAARVVLLCLAAFGLYVLYSVRDIAHVAAIATQGDDLRRAVERQVTGCSHRVQRDRRPRLLAVTTVGDECPGDTGDPDDSDGTNEYRSVRKY